MKCKECESENLRWTEFIKTNHVQNCRLSLNDCTPMFFLGCEECSATIAIVRASEVAAFLNACTIPDVVYEFVASESQR